VSVLIFDSFIGGIGKSGVYRTFFACNTEQHPFGSDASRVRAIKSHGWTIVGRVPLPFEVPWATWSMSAPRLEEYLSMLRTGCVSLVVDKSQLQLNSPRCRELERHLVVAYGDCASETYSAAGP
jgi:hypothetical protein